MTGNGMKSLFSPNTVLALLILVCGSVLSVVLPKKHFISQFGWLGTQCLAAYVLNRSYPLRIWGIPDLGKLVKWAFGVSIAIGGLKAFQYLYNIVYLPDDYSLYIHLNWFDRVLYVMNLIIIAPLVEEILFRGYFYRVIKIRYGVFWAVFFSTLFFAFFHLNSSSVLLGFIFAFVYEKSESLWGSIIVHSMSNLFIFVFDYVLQSR